MTFLIIFVWTAVLIIVICSIIFSVRQGMKKSAHITPHQTYKTFENAYEESQSPVEESSHEGHSPYGEYTQNHEDRIGRKLVAHPEPEPGYVVLNGVKRRIEDCKNL